MEEIITTILIPINNRTIIVKPIIPNIIAVHPCLLITITLLIIPLLIITTIMEAKGVMLILHVTRYIVKIITTS
jgi:hypothetical protein